MIEKRILVSRLYDYAPLLFFFLISLQEEPDLGPIGTCYELKMNKSWYETKMNEIDSRILRKLRENRKGWRMSRMKNIRARERERGREGERERVGGRVDNMQS